MHGVPISVVVGKLHDKGTQALEDYKEKMCTKATGFKQQYLQTARELPWRKKNIKKKSFFLSLSRKTHLTLSICQTMLKLQSLQHVLTRARVKKLQQLLLRMRAAR